MIILGMARTGTSALAHTVELLGVNMGQRMLPPKVGVNPKGFFEDREIFDLHGILFRKFGYRWGTDQLPNQSWYSKISPYTTHIERIIQKRNKIFDIWGFKNPSTTELLPIWIPALKNNNTEIKIILNTRRPYDCLQSLQTWTKRRHGDVNSAKVWLKYTLLAEKQTRKFPRIIVTYEQLMDNTSESVELLNDFLFPGQTVSDSTHQLISDFLDPDIRHHNNPTNFKTTETLKDSNLVYQMHRENQFDYGLVDSMFHKHFQ